VTRARDPGRPVLRGPRLVTMPVERRGPGRGERQAGGQIGLWLAGVRGDEGSGPGPAGHSMAEVGNEAG
jgi:hypothetical protein